MTEHRTWTDEQLSAFLDHQLEDHDADALMDDLSRDDSLAARLAELTEANAAISGAFDAPLHEPVPERLLAIVEGFKDANVDISRSADVVDLAARRDAKAAPKPLAQPQERWRMPLAAGFALVVGAVAGAQFGSMAGDRRLTQLEAAVIDSRDPLHRVLSTTPSAESATLPGDAQVRPILSFVDGSGRLCREFEMASHVSTALGVACRGEDNWRLELLVPAADRPDGAAGYVQASGYNEAAVDAVLGRLKASEPLSAERERALLGQERR